MERVDDAAALLGSRARRDEPIGSRTTYRVGGRAALFVEVDGPECLDAVGAVVRRVDIPLLILGRGSNLLVADAGWDGLCVALSPSYETVELDPVTGAVRAGAAAPYPLVARRTAAAGLRGLEWAVGIPGSVGGAVAMNAGGHGAETAQRLVAARVAHLGSGAESVVPTAELGLGYRRSGLSRTDLVLAAEFHTVPGDANAAEATIDEIVSWRREHQPGGRNGGSVFANPPGDAAGRLIEQAGLKGLRVGTAAVSDKHANFFQADQGGSAEDVRRLIEVVRAEVLRRCGVQLETELRLVGFER